ncbi:TetR/AcrR family transcriptional regulator [Phenylobacterium deserti]|uniref:TetR/AcrR family transcriptional regulator n=1 Tax=Phenylobacterium deserti TaxID=1914756 RepID=A0A328ADA2_9CAUL|nr:TetR/AcrR family transcriptional regulator [Phenylobacterium deserti]RAK51384.1 TetR/AcrR family transcriptional regulator [Phenylobacterium deserti]
MQQTTRPRLDRDARREAILDVAQDVFLDEGFAAASMSTIAARLGGSKGTLYNYFKSKDELFEAFVQRRCVWHQEAIFGDVSDGASMREALTVFAHRYILTTLSDASLRSLRLIIAEAERSPEIGQLFYENGPRRGIARLAGYMTRWAEQGLLNIEDPEAAAQFFMGLTKGRFHMARLCNVIPELTEDQAAEEGERAVRTFLRTYGTEKA